MNDDQEMCSAEELRKRLSHLTLDELGRFLTVDRRMCPEQIDMVEVELARRGVTCVMSGSEHRDLSARQKKTILSANLLSESRVFGIGVALCLASYPIGLVYTLATRDPVGGMSVVFIPILILGLVLARYGWRRTRSGNPKSESE